MENKKMKSFRRSIKAVSPVIATIIIVAIAITMSIAVAYWVLGLGSSFTKYEKVEFTTAYVTGSEAGGYFLHLSLKNTGSAAATVDYNVTMYNGKPDIYFRTDQEHFVWAWSGSNATMEPGAQSNAIVTLPLPSAVPADVTGFKSGMTIEVMLQTAAGKQYPKVITLP
jgi:archaeal type IV pilus assembly protein PilA